MPVGLAWLAVGLALIVEGPWLLVLAVWIAWSGRPLSMGVAVGTVAVEGLLARFRPQAPAVAGWTEGWLLLWLSVLLGGLPGAVTWRGLVGSEGPRTLAWAGDLLKRRAQIRIVRVLVGVGLIFLTRAGVFR